MSRLTVFPCLAQPAGGLLAAGARCGAAVRRLAACLFALVACGLAGELAAEVDEDFSLQGEYLGVASGGGYLGLQVVAMGDGAFAGRLLPGGLPGAGWDRSTVYAAQGDRTGKGAHLTTGQHEIAVRGGTAVIRDTGGRERARLELIRRISPTLDAPPPASATVLFDGHRTDHLVDAQVNAQGYLDVGFRTKRAYRDFQLHVEFRTPYMPEARGQGRGNSGIYLQRRYEVQVLDSFGLEGLANECGGLYKQKPPDVNMCLPPMAWQTYDIYFRAARFRSDGEKTAPARITVLHNGEPVHEDYALKNKTGAGRPEGPEPMPILFQNHRDPVVYRNLWIVDESTARGLPSPAACRVSPGRPHVDVWPHRIRRGFGRRFW